MASYPGALSACIHMQVWFAYLLLLLIEQPRKDVHSIIAIHICDPHMESSRHL